VVDHGLTKGVVYTPCTKKIDALGTAQLFISHIWKRFGLPDTIISDRGPQFASKVFQETCKLLKIDHRMSTAYHPQTDGETERVNQELETYLRIFCANEPRKWSTYLPMAEFTHNNRAHETSKMSPFQIIYGNDPKGIPTAFPRISAPAVETRLDELMKTRQEALAAHELARQTMCYGVLLMCNDKRHDNPRCLPLTFKLNTTQG
jgi:transposase InsO family protein